MAETQRNSSETDAHSADLPKRLLIADDEHLIVTGLSADLKGLGFKVVAIAHDGEQAIDLCREHGPDMALLDIRMPRKDGLEAAEVIYRQMNVPVMMISAYSDANYVATANRVGVFGYVLKPVSSDQLRVNIAVAWARYQDEKAAGDEIDGLKSRLADRKVIEQAKWIIVKRKDISEPEAMRLLQTRARNTRRQLAEVARSVIENEELFGTD